MAIYIERLNINCFRGIHSLEMSKFNHVNIIAGDNNSGKTSVLEAIHLLRNPAEFNNILRVALTREIGIRGGLSTMYEDFTNLFSRNYDPMKISIDAICNEKPVDLCLTGAESLILLSSEIAFQNHSTMRRLELTKKYGSSFETNVFEGELQYTLNKKSGNSPVEIHAHGKKNSKKLEKKDYLNIVYLSPFSHMRMETFNSILSDDIYKEICVTVLQMFDPEILDIFYLKDEITSQTVEYVKNSRIGNMPLSTYGDGIKKILAIANGIAKAVKGVLMIDELETSIHSRYYSDIFRFVIKACKQFQVQLFVTTHSMETIDELLVAQDYSNHDSDAVSVITLKKDVDKTYSRTLTGRHVLSNREEFGFEVRL